jgi:hypothetical protein
MLPRRLHIGLMVAAIIMLAACAAPRPPLVACAFYGPPSEDDAVLESPQSIMMLDGRPLVVPMSRRRNADCNLAVLRLPAGDHTVHVSVQLTGFSPYAADTYTAQACSFVAQPGQHYRMESQKEVLGDDVECTIRDLTTGGIVSRSRSGGSNLSDYFEMVRAYAGCDDPLARRELARLRGTGSLRRSFSEWAVRPCEAFLDFR